jgi:DivIVA domain-containing protein
VLPSLRKLGPGPGTRPEVRQRVTLPDDMEPPFLARAADALDARAAGRMPDVTADDVHTVVFTKPPLTRGRGYDEDAVDALLHEVEAVLRGGPAVGVEQNGRPLTG